MKKALITGITGQDGSYLAELLLGKDYGVHGSSGGPLLLIPSASITSIKIPTSTACGFFRIMATLPIQPT